MSTVDLQEQIEVINSKSSSECINIDETILGFVEDNVDTLGSSKLDTISPLDFRRARHLLISLIKT